MTTQRTGTEAYYEQRASEYDQVYLKPERQNDLRAIESRFQSAVRGKRLLEIAAGTGYWTSFFADSAEHVTATDINSAVLRVAASRRDWPPSVRFEQTNAFDLSEPHGGFDAAFVGFFWSHLTQDQLSTFVRHLAQRLEPASQVVIIDNRYVEGSSLPVTSTDASGNTYQRRRLEDGSEWHVLKNFPTPAQLRARLEPVATELQITEFEFYWIAELTT